jgi:hypothetical protein
VQILRSVFVFASLALSAVTSLRAQEIEEIPNWSAPPFWSAPVKWTKGAQPGAVPLEAEGLQSVAMPFSAVPPCRIADTRGNGFTGQAGPPIVLANTLRTFQVTEPVPGAMTQCGIVAGAIAVSFQFTVTTMTSAGNLIAWPSGPAPTTSVLNWNANSVAIGSGNVVQVSPTGALNVQINAPIGQAADLIIDVNGFYLPGGMDGTYVNEGQTSSVSSAMIADGAIVDADINAAAAIADTKLGTIATAGKVADSALSANVTKLGSTIEGSEITNITRSVNVPLASFYDCGSLTGAPLDFSNEVNAVPNFTKGGIAEGARRSLEFDATPGSPDQGYEVCSEFMVPPDYVSGGEFRVRAGFNSVADPATEVLNCTAGRNNLAPGPAGTVAIAVATNAFYTCTPTLTGLAAGDYVDFFFTITSSTTMDDTVLIHVVEFRYLAAQ